MSIGVVTGGLALCAAALLSIAPTALRIPSIELGAELDRKLAPLQPQLDHLVSDVGLNPPNVFNAADLRKGDAWPMIHRVEPDGSESSVPLAVKGGRGGWYHLSDVIYVGHSLPWRRSMIDTDLVAQHQPGAAGYVLIEDVLRYDYRRAHREGPVTYRIDLYQSRASDVDLTPGERFDSSVVYSYTQTIGG